MNFINARLSFGARQALISAVLLAPVLVLLTLFVTQCWKDIAFAQEEIRGSRYVDRIWTAMESGGRDLGPRQSEDDASFGTAAASRRFLNAVGPDTRWEAGMKLLSDVADHSNLILDPELDSYYAVVALNPRLLFLYQSAAGVTAAADSASPDRATRVAMAVDRLRVDAGLSSARLENAMVYNRAGVTRRNLGPDAGALDRAAERVASLGAALATGGDRGAFDAGQADLRAQINRTFTATDVELRRLLQARIHRLELKLEGSLAVVLLWLAAAAALAVAISQGLADRIHGLIRAIDRLGEDAEDAEIPNLDDTNETGRIARALAMYKESRTALHQTEQRLEFALLAGRLGSWELDPRTGRLDGSDHHFANLGMGPGLLVDSMEACLDCIHPADRAPFQAALRKALAEGDGLNVEFRVVRADQEPGWVEIRGRATYDTDGAPIRMAGVSLDITSRKADETRLKLMFDELNHRVKNTLATVQSVATQTLRTSRRPAAFEEAFRGRIAALAATHELLTEASWDGASLRDIAARALAPYAAADSSRVSIEGPGIMLKPTVAVTLHMAFHELATNAAKHGALSTGDGRVEVSWRIVPEAADGKVVEIDWREYEGPPVATTIRRGFGARLIEQGLARQLDAETQLNFAIGGVSCHIRMPLMSQPKLAA